MSTWQDEQRVAKAVRAHQSLSAADRRTAQRLLDREDRRRWIPAAYAAVAVLFLVLWAVGPGHPLWALPVALVVLLVAVAWWLLKVQRSRRDAAAIGLVPQRLRGGTPAPSGRLAAARRGVTRRR